jgi:ABC-type multidrug transport system ATPase subunit
MEEHPIAIEVKNLSKRYGSKGPESLSDISFQVPMGQICCLLGPNGSGKTTLLKTLAGLLKPTSGQFTVAGFDPLKNSRKYKSEIGWMPAEEKSGFYGRLTGRQNLMFFGTLQGMEEKEMDRVIGNISLQLGIDLNKELDQTVLKISSGAKQKLGLARALLHNPSILLLDEPTRNLDPHTTLRFRRLIKNQLTRNQKKTVLLSTHILEEARKLADILLIIKDGKIVRSMDEREMEKELKKSTLEEVYMKIVDQADPVEN